MNIVSASFEVLNVSHREPLKFIESVARTCYKSEGLITTGSAEKLVSKLISSGHEAMIEHVSITVKFICDRGVSHEIVRHRLASFAQESTRYCNYKNENIQFIAPNWLFDHDIEAINNGDWSNCDEDAIVFADTLAILEQNYKWFLTSVARWSPQEARSILPNALKTEINIMANLKEWHHIFLQRAAPSAHPQMREIMIPLLQEFKTLYPSLFSSIPY